VLPFLFFGFMQPYGKKYFSLGEKNFLSKDCNASYEVFCGIEPRTVFESGGCLPLLSHPGTVVSGSWLYLKGAHPRDFIHHKEEGECKDRRGVPCLLDGELSLDLYHVASTPTPNRIK
jgi:hypothetical protein